MLEFRTSVVQLLMRDKESCVVSISDGDHHQSFEDQTEKQGKLLPSRYVISNHVYNKSNYIIADKFLDLKSLNIYDN